MTTTYIVLSRPVVEIKERNKYNRLYNEPVCYSLERAIHTAYLLTITSENFGIYPESYVVAEIKLGREADVAYWSFVRRVTGKFKFATFGASLVNGMFHSHTNDTPAIVDESQIDNVRNFYFYYGVLERAMDKPAIVSTLGKRWATGGVPSIRPGNGPNIVLWDGTKIWMGVDRLGKGAVLKLESGSVFGSSLASVLMGKIATHV